MIRITRQTDYAILLMTHLSVEGADPLQNARDLSSVVNLPLPTVSKILKAMARAGLLTSHRGVKGGYSMARPAGEISIAEIIEALEGPIALTECLDDTTADCSIECTCPTRTNWQRINVAVRDALASVPLSEMTTLAVPDFTAQLTNPTRAEA